jgi:DNA topoisomerase-1
MAKNLVVVESPAKCKTISKYLGKDYIVRATMGHIIDLPEKELGVDLENDFKPKYVVSKGKRKIVKALKDDAAKAENVFLAPDPDREGEAIAWHVAQSIGNDVPIKRVQFNEITKRAVLAAFDSPRDIDMNKVNAQQARRILDRIVGYQISPILWRTVFRGLSAGRVQSVALRLICEREDAVRAFVQKEYWSIEGLFENNGVSFIAKLLSVKGKKAADIENPLLPDGASAKAVIDRLKNTTFAVSDVVKSEKERKPYPPFITSTIQQEAARKLGFSAAKTMMVAQQLYEGLELGGLGSLGLITYMRTDSTRLAQEALADASTLIKKQFGAKFAPAAPRIYGKNKKNAQDAHEAIRPSQVDQAFAPENVQGYLSKDQYRLYDLVWKRFLASQMENAVFDQLRIDISGDDCVFRANGNSVKFQGFLVLYDESTEETPENADDENAKVPLLSVKDAVALKKLIDKQHFTQPPARYSEASLVRELEDKGIGRPSTYAQIIDTLKRRKYVELENRRFTPTEVGFTVKGMLVKEFPEIFDVGFTAGMELNLDKIEDGEAEWISVLREFYEPLSKRLETVKGNIKELRAQNQEETDRDCPLCGKNKLVIKWSRNGKFYACQGFPACKYTESYGAREAAPHGEVCDLCGSPMVVIQVNGRKFLGCSRYPECKNTKSLPTGVHCPQPGCEGAIVERKTRRGKTFYGCNAYPKCTFATWDKPVNTKCEHCGFPMMVYKENQRKGAFLRCPSCKNETPLPELTQSANPVEQAPVSEASD